MAMNRPLLSRPPRLIPVFAWFGLLLVPGCARAQQADLDAVATRVADAVCGSQVVLLGELPSHGEARAFEAKAKIAQQLIDRCGFDALLFEGPQHAGGYMLAGREHAVDLFAKAEQ